MARPLNTTSRSSRSIYEQALGDEFRQLHPRIQERFGFRSKDHRASVGTGVMLRNSVSVVLCGKFPT